MLPVQLDVSDAWRDVSDTTALCLYRVAQRGSCATSRRTPGHWNVTVALDQLDGNLTMQVTDDGCGFDPAPPRADRGWA